MSLVSGPQLKAARALASIEQEQLAATAGVGVNTISKLEQQREFDGARVGTIRALQRALEKAGIVFIDDGGEPGVRLRRKS
jgi:transcriptional regulator with XRE-family HTH domain